MSFLEFKKQQSQYFVNKSEYLVFNKKKEYVAEIFYCDKWNKYVWSMNMNTQFDENCTFEIANKVMELNSK